MLSATMAEGKTKNGCPRCAELEARVATLEALVASLQAALAKAQKNSGNSSKPPSSDIVKPRRKTGKNERRGKPNGSHNDWVVEGPDQVNAEKSVDGEPDVDRPIRPSL